MAPEASLDFYIETLKDKYKAALREEETAIDLLNGARRRREVYAQTLREEGVDVAQMNGFKQSSEHLDFDSQITRLDILADRPVSGAHAFHLILKSNQNAGMTFKEMKRYSDKERYELSEKALRNIFWRQHGKGFVERVPEDNTKVRLTQKGLKFDKFRVQKLK